MIFMKVIEVNHPLIKHKLTVLRDKNTDPKEFREVVEEITLLLGYKATEDLMLEQIPVETPLEKTIGHKIRDEITLIPILRSGMGVVSPLLKIIPDASVFHFG